MKNLSITILILIVNTFVLTIWAQPTNPTPNADGQASLSSINKPSYKTRGSSGRKPQAPAIAHHHPTSSRPVALQHHASSTKPTYHSEKKPVSAQPPRKVAALIHALHKEKHEVKVLDHKLQKTQQNLRKQKQKTKIAQKQAAATEVTSEAISPLPNEENSGEQLIAETPPEGENMDPTYTQPESTSGTPDSTSIETQPSSEVENNS